MGEYLSTKDEVGTRPRMKILLIAYACEPNRGSEPGTGWNMALGLAAGHELTVATRANNRGPVEAALRDTPEDKRPKFLYLDPPPWALRLKARKIMPIQMFYFFWQKAVAKHLRDSGERFDILHQLTFNSFEVPPFAFAATPGFRIWGPVGGGQTVPHGLLRAFGSIGAIKEAWRNWRVALSAKTPWVRETLRNADMVLFANGETSKLLGPQCKGKTGMMIDVGVDVAKFQASPTRPDQGGNVTFLAAGRLEARKGFGLLVDAFASFVVKQPRARLRIVGDGPERRRLERQIIASDLAKAVVLTGAVGHDEMQREFESADVFVFPSLRDTSGAVVLEAMAMGLPIICLDHQGAAIMIADGCGLRVQTGSYGATIKALADALTHLSNDPELRRQLGENARRRADEEFSWTKKIARTMRIYEKVERDGANLQF